MPALKSSVLLVALKIEGSENLGVDYAEDFESAIQALKEHPYRIVLVEPNTKNFVECLLFLDNVLKQRPQTRILLGRKKINEDKLFQILNRIHIFKIVEEFLPDELQNLLESVLEAENQIEQNQQMQKLLNEQNEKLRQLQIDLAERIEKRTRYLTESRHKLQNTNKQIALLHRALVVIYESKSVNEMENSISQLLNGPMNVSGLKIFLGLFNREEPKFTDLEKKASIFWTPLFCKQEEFGVLCTLRPLGSTFRKDETAFFSQIAEMVSLAIDRLEKREQIEALNDQWEVTFNSISDPVCIIDENYTVIQTNKSFLMQASAPADLSVIGKKCFEVLFHRSSPCQNCSRGGRFQIADSNSTTPTVIEVLSHPLKNANQHLDQRLDQHLDQRLDPSADQSRNQRSDQRLYVNVYHDITEATKLEKRILESTKMAELGTIGSSIAHELNNPLAGMLSFLQLIKIDIEPNTPLFVEIEEMEQGVKRCRDIVENLLGFSRASESDERQKIDLRVVISRAIKILELQTRSKGIEVKLAVPEFECFLEASRNLLSQAFQNYLQVSLRRIENLRRTTKTHGSIQLNLYQKAKFFICEIVDNGISINKDQNQHNDYDFKLSIANQIVKEHGGQTEIYAPQLDLHRAKINLPLWNQDLETIF